MGISVVYDFFYLENKHCIHFCGFFKIIAFEQKFKRQFCIAPSP